MHFRVDMCILGVFILLLAVCLQVGHNSSIWYGATLRGDVQKITIGHTSNIQDRAVVHVAKYNPLNVELPTIIGNKVRD